MAALDWSQCPAVESIPGRVSGAWVFRGTRMPVATVFENLEAGATIDDIMKWFDVTRLCRAVAPALAGQGYCSPVKFSTHSFFSTAFQST